MTRLIVLVGLFCSGCVVLPTTKTTAKSAGTAQSPVTYGRIKAVQLQTGSSASNVRVRAMNKRECHRQILAVTEITKSKHAKLGVDDPRGRVLGVFLAPLTIPISAIITGFIVASTDDETSRVTKPLRNETTECTTDAAGLAVELQFPSGHVYRGMTDRSGVLVAEIPIDEPYGGDVVVRGGQTSAQVHYEQVAPPVTVARDALEGCRQQHQVGGVTLELAIDHRGRATRVSLSAGDAKFNACVSRKIAGLRFPSELRDVSVVLPFEQQTARSP